MDPTQKPIEDQRPPEEFQDTVPLRGDAEHQQAEIAQDVPPSTTHERSGIGAKAAAALGLLAAGSMVAGVAVFHGGGKGIESPPAPGSFNSYPQSTSTKPVELPMPTPIEGDTAPATVPAYNPSEHPHAAPSSIHHLFRKGRITTNHIIGS